MFFDVTSFKTTVYCLDIARVTVILATNIALCRHRYHIAEPKLTVINDNRAHAGPWKYLHFFPDFQGLESPRKQM